MDAKFLPVTRCPQECSGSRGQPQGQHPLLVGYLLSLPMASCPLALRGFPPGRAPRLSSSVSVALSPLLGWKETRSCPGK